VTVNHPQFGLMCEICFSGLKPEDCAEDVNGDKWDICKGQCATDAGIKEVQTLRQGNQGDLVEP
jgi:hypothetical protein